MKEILLLLLITSASISTAQYTFIDLENQGSDPFKKILDAHKVIAIGEIHGATEVPQLVLELAKAAYARNKDLTVALEISSNFQTDIDAFMVHGQTERLKSVEHFQYPDGRSSMGMVGLLLGLRELPGIKVACFDVEWGKTRTSTRDSIMGVNLHRLYRGQQMIILTGNFHAVLDLESMRPGYKSALYHFKEHSGLTEEVIALNTYFGGGTIWNCRQEGCKEYPIGHLSVKENNGLTTFIRYDKSKLEKGYHGFVFFDQVSASQPFGSEWLRLYDFVNRFKTAITQKDSVSFKKLFFREEISFVGNMSKPSEASIRKDNPEFHGVSISNSNKFIREVCLSDKLQEKRVHNISIKTNGLIAAVTFDYAYYSEGKMRRWGNEKWNAVLEGNGWLITDVVYSVHLPKVERPPFEGE